jgi:Fe-S cluster assembly protein SufB
MAEEVDIIDQVVSQEYKYGFTTNIEMETAPKGLNEDIVRFISAKKNEPEWMLEYRLKAYQHWLKMEEPQWQNFKYPTIDYQDSIYYAAPKQKVKLDNLDEVDPELLKTFERARNQLQEQKRLTGVAVDAVIRLVFLLQLRSR